MNPHLIYLAPKEFARKIGVSTSTLRRWEKEGTIAPLRTPTGHRRYSLDMVEDYLKEKEDQMMRKTEHGKQCVIYTQMDETPVETNIEYEESSHSKFIDGVIVNAVVRRWHQIGLVMIGLSLMFALIAFVNMMRYSLDMGEESTQTLAKQQSNHPGLNFSEVLAATTFKKNTALVFNIPIEFRKNINARGITIDANEGKVFASNLLYGIEAGEGVVVSDGQTPIISFNGVQSVNGNRGYIEFTGGEGISVSGLEIVNDDKGSSQNIFKNINSNGTIVKATENDDTLKLTSGSGISLSTSGKEITISANTNSSYSYWTTKVNGVIYDNIVDKGKLEFLSGSDINVTRSSTNQLTFALQPVIDTITTINLPSGGAINGTDSTINFTNFDVSASGGVTIAGGQTYTVGSIGLNSTSPTPGASLVGVNISSLNNSNPLSSDLQTVLQALDSAMGSGSSKWSIGSGVLYPTNPTVNNFAVGGSVINTAPLGVDVTNSIVYVNGTAQLSSTIYAPNIGTGTDNSVLVLNSAGYFVTDEIDSRVWGSGLLDSSTGFVQNGNSFSALATLGTNDAYGLAFETNNTERMRIDSSGNVGIGTTSPGAKLEITNGSGYEIQFGGYGAANILQSIYGEGLFISTNNGPLNLGATADATHLTIIGSGNVGIGTTAPNNLLQVHNLINFDDASNSTALGYQASAQGHDARTTAVGYQAGYANSSSASDFTAIGYRAGYSNAAGDALTAIGSSAGFNATGDLSTYVGYSSGYSGISDIDSTYVGASAGYFNVTGDYNTIIGKSAGRGTSGQSYSRNTIVGTNAGYALSTGSNNLLLGYQVGNSLSSGSNNIAIGYDIDLPSDTASNQLNIGNTIYGDLLAHTVGIGTTSPSETLDVTGSLILGTSGNAYFKIRDFDDGSITSTSIIGRDGNIQLFSGGLVVGNYANNVVGTIGAGSAIFSGNIGIGTTIPSQALHVSGNARITGALYDSSNSAGSSTNILTSTGTGTAWTSVSSAFDTTYFKQNGNSFTGLATLGTNDAYGLAFETNSIERLRIDTSGNVGIGTTAPNNLLSLHAVSAAKSAVGLKNTTTENSEKIPSSASGWYGTGGNAYLSDDQYATASCGGFCYSDDLQLTGFGFSVPANAVITGIQVSVERSKSTPNYSVDDTDAYLLKSGSPSGSDKGTYLGWTNVDTVVTYGGSSDMWGTTWTPADVNASNFGFSLKIAAFNSAARVDQVKITVYYTLDNNWTTGIAANSSNYQITYGTDFSSNNYLTVLSSGNVGIGTTSPSSPLEVAGDAEIANYLYFGNSTSEYLRWDSSNFLLSDDLLPNANDALDLGSDTARWKDLYLGGETLHIGTSTSDEGSISYDTANNIFNFDTDSTTNGDIAFFTDDLYLDKSTGNVGIGTTELYAKLHVVSHDSNQSNFTSQYSNNQAITTSVENTGMLASMQDSGTIDGNGDYTERSTRGIDVNISDSGILNNNGGQALKNLIGVTVLANDSGSSHLSGISTVYGGYFQASGKSTNVSGTAYGLYTTASGADINYGLYSAGGLNYFAGNVGIGTTSPGSALDLVGDMNISGGLSVNVNKTSSTGIAINVQESGLAKGINVINTGAGSATSGLYNTLEVTAASSYKTGVHNTTTNDGVSGSSSFLIGTWNELTGTGSNSTYYGTYNTLFPKNADLVSQNLYGTYTSLKTHAGASDVGYGEHIIDDNASTGGTQYGVYLNLDDTDVTRYGIYEAGGATNYFAGNVGIGTTSPGAILNVVGTSIFQGDTTFKDGNVIANAFMDDYDFIVRGDMQVNLLYADASSNKIGIGTSLPSQSLDVVGSGAFSGNVGIGTTAPSQALHVSGNARITGALYDSSNSAGSNTNILTSTGTGTAWTTVSSAFDTTYFKQNGNSFTALATLGTNDAYGLAFETGGTEWMRILTDGKVGIGTTAPLAKLEVKDSSSLTSLGSEMIINADDRTFASDLVHWSGTNWTIGSGVSTHTAGANVYTLSNTYLSSAPVSSSIYSVAVTVNTTVAGTLAVSFGGATAFTVGQSTGTVYAEYLVTASNTNPLTITPNAAWTGTIDNVSIKEVTSVASVAMQLSPSDGNTIPIEFRTGSDTSNNILIGYKAGQYGLSYDIGDSVAIGSHAMQYAQDGSNVAVGGQALQHGVNAGLNTSVGYLSSVNLNYGYNNVAFGYYTFGDIKQGSSNVAIGSNAGNGTSNAYNVDNNVFVGYSAGGGVSSGGSNNVILGYQAGNSLGGGTGNVFLGYQTGYNETGSNKLYIDNSNTTSPLIWGDFNTNVVNFNGNVGIGTTSPSSPLEVAGDAEIANYLYFGNSTSEYLRWDTSNFLLSDDLLPNANDSLNLGSDTARWADLFLGGETLHLGASTTDEGTISYTSSNILSFDTDATTNGDIAFFTDDLYLDKSSGNVGIGTTSPTSRLAIKDSSSITQSGSEMITNADDRTFGSDLGHWSGTNWTIGSGVSTHTPGANAYSLSSTYLSSAPVASRVYKVTMTVTTTSTGTLAVAFGGTTAFTVGQVTGTVYPNYFVTATNTNDLTVTPNGTWAGSIDWVSIKEVTTKASVALSLIPSDGNSTPLEFRTSADSSYSLYMGYLAGEYTDSYGASDNVGIGYRSLRRAQDYGNVAIGSIALENGVDVAFNNSIGYQSMVNLNRGYNNQAMGYYTLPGVRSGDNNVAIGGSIGGNSTVSYGVNDNIFLGYSSGYKVSSGAAQNVIIGSQAGYNLGANTGNVFLGYNAGYNETTSNKLYIDNSNTTSPLIWGDFNTNVVNFNGNVGIGTTAPSSALSFGSSSDITRGTADGTDNGLLTLSGGGAYSTTRGGAVAAYGNEHASFPGYVTMFGGNIAGGGALNFYTQDLERMRITYAGNVGIGTTSPLARLEVIGVDSLNTSLTSNMSGATGTGLVVTNAGRVGIGTTVPAYKFDLTTTNGKVQLGDYGETWYSRFGDDANGPNQFFYKTRGTSASPTAVSANDNLGQLNFWGRTTSSAGVFARIQSDVDGDVGDSDRPGRLIFLTTPDGSGTLTERMRITNGGNVGIGTTAPNGKLTVYDNSGVPQLPMLELGVDADALSQNENYPAIGLEFNSYSSGSPTKLASLYAQSGPSGTGLNISTNDQQRIWIDNGGSVAIGTGINYRPDRKLEVLDTTGNQLRLTQTDASVYADFNVNADGDLVIGVDNISSQLVLDNGGSVGIGTTSPGAKLEVNGRISQVGLNGSTLIGYSAGLNDDLTANLNTAVGYQALKDTNSGYENTTIGANALSANTSGYYNIVVGSSAGLFQNSGTYLTTNNNSVFLGYDTRSLLNGNSNEIVIGSSARGIGSNSVVLGNDSITTTALKGNVGIGTTSPTAKLHTIGSNGATAQNAPEALRIIGGTGGAESAPMEGDAGTGGGLYLAAGDGGAAADTGGTGGNISILAGDGGTGAFRGSGGNINISAGSGEYAGKVTISGGAGDNVMYDWGTIDLDGHVSVGSYYNGALSTFNINGSANWNPMRIYMPSTSATKGLILANTDTSANSKSGLAFQLTHASISEIDAALVTVGKENLWTATNSTKNAFLAFHTASSGSLSEKLRITSGGNVGIGTTAPSSALSFGSNSDITRATADGTDNGLLTLSGGGTYSTTRGGAVAAYGNEHASFPGYVTMFGGNIAGGGALNFYTQDLERMRITYAGNVGIGTTSPGAALEVNGDIKLTSSLQKIFWNSSYDFIADGGIYSSSGQFIRIDSDSTTSDSYLDIQKDSGTSLLFVSESGNVGIGTTAPSYALDVKSTGTDIARFTGTNSTGCTLSDGGVIACSSDQNLKKNIVETELGLDTVMNLRPVEFNWNSQAEGDQKYLGFIAQEVEQIAPNLVTIDSNGYRQLNSIGLIPVVAKAIQEQQGILEQTSASVQTTADKQDEITQRQNAGEQALNELTTKVNAWDNLFISIQSIIQTIQDTFVAIQTQLGLVQSDVAMTKQDIASMSASLNKITIDMANWRDGIASESGVLGASNSASLDDGATVSALLVKDNLTVEGKTTTFDLTVLNKLTTGVIELGAGIDGDEINSSTGIRFQTLAQGPVDFMNGKVIINADGSVEMTHLKLNTTDPNTTTIGTAVIESGHTSMTIDSTIITSESMVFITPTSYIDKPIFVNAKIPGVGFVVTIAEPATKDIDFQWMIVN